MAGVSPTRLANCLDLFAEALEAGVGEVLAAGGLEPALFGAVDFAPGAGDDFAEGAGALGFFEDGFVRALDERGVAADFDHLNAGEEGLDDGFLDGHLREDAAHLHVVGEDDAFEANLAAEDVGDPVAGDGGGRGVAAGPRIGRVGDHSKGQTRGEGEPGGEVGAPHEARLAMDDRHGLVGVDLAAAEAGKMLAAGEDLFVLHAGEEATGVVDDTAGLGGDRAGEQDGGGLGQGEVEDGREDGVATEGAGFAGDEPSVLAVEVALAGGEDGRRRGHGVDEVAQTIDEAAFEVDAAKERGRAAGAGIAKQRGDLGGALDVAAEEDDAAGTNALQPGALFCGEGGAAETGDEELAGLLGELHVAAARHEDARPAAAIAAGWFGRSGMDLCAPGAHGLVSWHWC